ncbi:hypothetical protein [Aureimonas pseudogalii]|uniref:Uncharacterized protein n=1 Tax=Aureimonas pseudogalii TaxID=1744844 RepID=A0A7W6H8C2_9HYPH|nr:hypothetical protein [Aureimonas pseudogalii]MBB4000494.1 hypothetical protein [Aureimonas pseudogalii]
MSDLAKALSDRALQASVQRALDGRPRYQIDHSIPNALQEKLDALDRAVAARAVLWPRT